MRIADYLHRIGVTEGDVPDVAFTCTCEWFPPTTGPGDPQEAAVAWCPDCPVHDEDPTQEVEWHYEPAAMDPDPGKMWHYGCGGEVSYIDDGYICHKCRAQQEGRFG